MVIAIPMFEENIILGRNLRINFIATDDRRKIEKIVVLLYSGTDFKVST